MEMDYDIDYDKEKSETCPHCLKKFTTCETKRRHIRKFHPEKCSLPQVERHNRIICSACYSQDYKTYYELEKHIWEVHGIISIKEEISFENEGTFQEWFIAQMIEVNYSVVRSNKRSEFYEKIYSCNRNNITGYLPKCQKRTEKSGGSIKIKGTCLSRYIVKKYIEGNYSVLFYGTHTGHKEESRAQHLSKSEREYIVDKLSMGISVDRIVNDARIEHTSGRMGMLNRQDVINLRNKLDIEKQIDKNEMFACAPKVEECNSDHSEYTTRNTICKNVHNHGKGTIIENFNDTESEITKRHQEKKIIGLEENEINKIGSERNQDITQTEKLLMLTKGLSEENLTKVFKYTEELLAQQINETNQENKKRKWEK